MDFSIWPAPFSLVAGIFVSGGIPVAVAWIQPLVLATACAVSAGIGAMAGWRARRNRPAAPKNHPGSVPLETTPDPFVVLVGSLPVPSWLADANGKILQMNDFAREALGLTPESANPSFESWNQPAEIKTHWLDATQRAFRGQVVKEPVAFHLCGVVRHALQVIIPLSSIAGDSRALGLLFEPAPEKKPVAQSVNQEETLGRFCRVAPFPVIEWDATGKVRSWNPAAELLFGYSADDAIGKKGGELIIPVDQSSRYANAWTAVAEQGRSVNIVLQSRTKVGSIVPCEWASFPIFNEHQRVTSVVSFVKGTAGMSLEGHTPEEARHLDALGRLASGAAHAFNALLSPMLIEVERLAAHAGEPERILTHVNSLRLAIQHAQEMTDRAQLLRGDRTEAPEWIDLSELVKKVLNGVRASLDSRITLDTTVTPSLPRLHLSRNGLVQILTQLIFLARDSLAGSFTGSAPLIGRPTIVVSTRRFEGVNPSAPERGVACYQVLCVRDNGPGLNDEAKARAFEPFFPSDSPGSGHGRGLHLVWRLAHLHEGWVALETGPGRGSEVSVFIPEIPRDEVRPPTGTPIPQAEEPMPRKSGVLLVEDNLLVANALSGVLSDRGFEVYFAETGERAWALLDEEKGKIDVILSDLNLPGMSGRELLGKLRDHGHTLPMIILSGDIGGIDASELLALGATGLITKPVNPRELIETVTRAAARPS